MFESLISSVGIWSGNVVLNNLKLKTSALDKFNLPINVSEGYLGNLNCTIPWNDLKNKPIKIEISDIYILAVPKLGQDYDYQEEFDSELKHKFQRLAQAELLTKEKAEVSLKDQSFVTQLTAKIIDNLQFSIKNIHIRYEDKINVPESPFSAGITLSELSAISTDSLWNEAFIHDLSDGINKYVKLGSLAMYWNTELESLENLSGQDAFDAFVKLIASKGQNNNNNLQYILRPVCGIGKDYVPGSARNFAEIEFDELGFELDDDQFNTGLALLNAFELYMRSYKYRKFRPPRTVPPAADPKAWFKYAGNCVLFDVHEKNRKWTWEYLKERRDDRISYVNVYKLSQTMPSLPINESALLFQLERKLSYQDLRFYRSIARNQLRKKKLEAGPVEKVTEKVSTWSSWLGWSSGEQNTEDEKEKNNNVFTQDHMKQLCETIEYDPEAAFTSSVFPDDAVLFNLSWLLNTGSLSIKSGKRSKQPKELMKVIFSKFSANILKFAKVGSYLADVSLQGMECIDGTTSSKVYTHLVKAKQAVKGDSKFFQMVAELKPLDERADNAVQIRMLPLEVVYNPAAIKSLVSFFTPPSDNEIESGTQFTTLKAAAQNTFQGITNQTRLGLEYAIEEHKTLDLKVDIDAPVFIFPENVNDPESTIVVLDAGHFLIESKLANKVLLKDISQKKTQLNEHDMDQLKSMLYDVFTIELSSVQVLVGNSYDACLNELENQSSTFDLHFIERVNIMFSVHMCILPKETAFTWMKIFGELPRLHLNLSDKKYKSVMKILDSISGGLSSDEATHMSSSTKTTVQLSKEEWNLYSQSKIQHSDADYFSDDDFEDANEEFVSEENEIDEKKVLEELPSLLTKSQDISELAKVLMECSFNVGEVSISLKRSTVDSISAETELAEMSVKLFQLKYTNRPLDTKILVQIASAEIEDKIENGTDPKFRYLLSKLEETSTAENSNVEHFIYLSYESIKKVSPDFHGVDQKVDVTFGALNVVLTRKSILDLYDFLLTAFVSKEEKKTILPPEITEEDAMTDPLSTASDMEESTFVVSTSLKSINLLLNRDGTHIATSSFDDGQISVVMKNKTMKVNGTLGNFSIVDHLVRPSAKDPSIYRDFISVEGGQVADFVFESFDISSDNYPGYDSSLNLFAPSVKVTFLEDFCIELQEYLSEFQKMHALVESARKAAYDKANHMQESGGKFHFNIQIQTPILVFPEVSLSSKNFISMYLGKITAKNNFSEASAEKYGSENAIVIDEISARLESMKLISTFDNENESGVGTSEETDILEDVHADFNITRFNINGENITKNSLKVPDLQVAIKMSPVQLKLIRKQYILMLDLIDSLQHAFSSDDGRDTSSFSKMDQISEDVSKENVQDEKRSTMDFLFELPKITLEIFQLLENKESSLAEFLISRVFFKQCTLLNGTSKMEAEIGALKIFDTRQTDNIFKDVLRTITKPDQSMLSIQSTSEKSKATNYLITFDSPKVTLILDHIFAIGNFFADEKKRAKKPRSKRNATVKDIDDGLIDLKFAESPDAATPTDSIYRVNVVDLEIIVLQNVKVASTEAIILVLKHLVIAHDGITSYSAHDLGMFFCAMDQRAETALRFIQNFDLALTVEDAKPSPGHKLTDIKIDVTPLMLRVSYKDVLLILDIVNQISELASSNEKNENFDEKGAQEVVPINNLIMSRETLKLHTQGLRLILIDDLNDLHLPMFDFIVDRVGADVKDWSTQMEVRVALSMQVNYFNIKNSHWEPIIEPWSCSLNTTKTSEGATAITFSSKKKLEFNLSHIFIETALKTFNRWDKKDERKLSIRRKVHAPYILINRTGYDMHVWADGTTNGLDTEFKLLSDGEEMSWRFGDWRVLRESTTASPNKISLQISGPAWESLKSIAVDREGVRSYLLRPSIDQVSHQLVCEVTLKDNVKVVTFRSSTALENSTNVTLEVVTINSAGKLTSKIQEVLPGKDYAVPIITSYFDKLLIRPKGFGYHWSKEVLFWKELQRDNFYPLVSSFSPDRNIPPFLFQVNSTFEKGEYPKIRMKILPPFQFENLLPYDIKYQLTDKTKHQEHKQQLASGKLDTIHTLNPTHFLVLRIQILGTDYRESEVAVITNSDLGYRDENVTLKDHEGNTLMLRIKYSNKLEKGGRKVTIYSPYVILNKTGLDLKFSASSLMSQQRLAAGQVSRVHNPEKVEPLMFAYSNFDTVRNRAQVKLPDSDWSRPLSFEAVGSDFDVAIPLPKRNKSVHLGISINEGEGKVVKKIMQKLVTVCPRYNIINEMSEDLNFRQHGSNAVTTVQAKSSLPFHYLELFEDPVLLSVRRTGLLNEWSQPFIVNNIGKTFVKVGKVGGSEEEDLLNVEIVLEGAAIFLIVSRNEGHWPFLIENSSEQDVVIWQSGSNNNYIVQKDSKKRYAWDNPSAQNKVLVVHVNGKEREIDLLDIGNITHVKYPVDMKGSQYKVLCIQIVAEGPVLVIRLSQLPEQYRRTADPSTASSSDSLMLSQKDAEVALFSFRFRMEGVGISLINQHMQELLYASFKDFSFTYVDGTTIQKLEFTLKWIQIDNQLYGCIEPIFVYPTNLPKDGDEQFRPVLLGTLTKSKDISYGLDYYHFCSILLQELSFDIDEDFLNALLEFSKFNVAGWEEIDGKLYDPEMVTPHHQVSDGDVRMYFERLFLQPIKINVSFARTKTSNEDSRPRSHNILTFFFDGNERKDSIFLIILVFTMAIGNIHDAPIRMNSLELHHSVVTFQQLVNSIMTFYSQEAVGQIHKVIGSADFLGNPVGLFNSVSSGVWDLFYEPIQGFEITRPQDFGIGLAKLLEASARAYQLLHWTMKNKPKHAVSGVTQGVSSFFGSIGSGVEGLVSKPMEGAEKEGVSGFFKGLGKGVVGKTIRAITKPVIGVFDLASTVTEGIKNTTTVFELDLDRQRLPRYIGKDGILKPYDPREALGLSYLKAVDNGEFFHEDYIAHLDLRNEDLLVLVTNLRVLMIRIKKLRYDWNLPYSDVQLIRLESGGITLIQKGNRQTAKAKVIPCPDSNSAQWLCSKIEAAFGEYISRHKSAD
ncbi:hypothetical protein HK099_002420 [Clydaea vesicula]|uniref:Vacuolar protein sorting-associated protein n=1 Tax=Clydaea vesicula TaxID=447962 RepID=A0AAD5Y3C1_9FUNG|nr:hypothetical protein HK099_002420 [Clydaea vesicula]